PPGISSNPSVMCTAAETYVEIDAVLWCSIVDFLEHEQLFLLKGSIRIFAGSEAESYFLGWVLRRRNHGKQLDQIAPLVRLSNVGILKLDHGSSSQVGE